jgi:hypothetical protein
MKKVFLPDAAYYPLFLVAAFCASILIFYLASDASLTLVFASYLFSVVSALITLYFVALLIDGAESYYLARSLKDTPRDPIGHLRLRKRIKKPTLIDVCHGTPIAETVFVCGQYAAAKTVHTVHTINDRFKRAAKSSPSSRNQPNES